MTCVWKKDEWCFYLFFCCACVCVCACLSVLTILLPILPPARSDGMSGAPYNVQAPATSLLLSTTTSVATTTTAKSYGQSLQSTSLAKQGSNVCIEGRARLEDRPEAIFAPRFRNYKCFVQLSASQLGYLTKFFHLHRSRDIANAFNRLQTKHGSVLQFDKDARRYFFYSADEQATVNAAHEMAMLSVLHECNIHLRAHLCLQEVRILLCCTGTLRDDSACPVFSLPPPLLRPSILSL